MCQKRYRNRIPEGSFCVWSGNGVVDAEPCAYDSGGPVLNIESKIVGLVSSGYGCKEEPGVCTLISKHYPWIDEVLQKDSNPNTWF
ncbi:hypothetical protein ILUMI_17455 [Ignelater luminosus]|uniref:Peptidase S1 domain-containing protein n=1 Tax=Ignelater luminosus TaxID=2038154 RepID=A0A8K0G7W8_IGNLU|nr:hypothetical protein ILUMI_17455 [Ignelater luminosus]